MPALVSNHLNPAAKIYSRLKTTSRRRRSVLGVIKGWEELSNRDTEFLRNNVEFNLVTIAEGLSVRQLDGIIDELYHNGLSVGQIIVNQVVIEPDSEFLRSRADMQQKYFIEIESSHQIPVTRLPLLPYEVKGLERLNEVARVLFGNI
jgi:anion-transporting  ArsA/GET3 family ATPase